MNLSTLCAFRHGLVLVKSTHLLKSSRCIVYVLIVDNERESSNI